MAEGYSGTPLLQKLGVKPNSRVRLIEAPAWISELVGIAKVQTGSFDVAVAFCHSASSVIESLKVLLSDLPSNGAIWIAWPKKSSGLKTDCSDQVVRDNGLATGLVDNKVCAIDTTWSALRFVVRTKNRGS